MRVNVSFATPLVVIHKRAANLDTASFTFQSGDLNVTGENMASTMTAGTTATVTVVWKDFTGRPVTVDGPTTWTSTDPKMIVVSAAPPKDDSQTAHISAPGPIGKCAVHANADADLGTGVIPVTATIDIEVIAGQATSGDITFTPDAGPPPKGTPPQTPLTGARR